MRFAKTKISSSRCLSRCSKYVVTFCQMESASISSSQADGSASKRPRMTKRTQGFNVKSWPGGFEWTATAEFASNRWPLPEPCLRLGMPKGVERKLDTGDEAWHRETDRRAKPFCRFIKRAKLDIAASNCGIACGRASGKLSIF